MGKKWWYLCGSQMLVPIVLLCLTSVVFAAPLKTEAAKKGKPGALAKKRTSQPVPLTLARSQTKTPKVGKHTRAEIRKKRFRLPAKTTILASSLKSRHPSAATKTVHRTITTKNTRLAASQLKITRATPKLGNPRQAHRTIANVSRRVTKKQQAQLRSAIRRRVLALKESKKRQYGKTGVLVSHLANRGEFSSPATITAAARPQTSSDSPAPTSFSTSESVIETTPTSESVMLSTEQQVAPLSPHSDDTQPQRSHSWSGYTPERAAFHVKFNGERLLHRLNSAFVLPGDEIFVEVEDGQRKNDYAFHTTLEKERQLGPTRWYWHAPALPGLYSIKVHRTRPQATVTLNVFVIVPLERIEDGMLNGYRIGHYPTVALRQQAIYTPPRGLIEITRENEHMLVSPHFRLRQFLCKQESDYPKYLALDARLLTALELLLEKANAQGYHARTFTVMSGYRTPYYNRAIGNSTTYSRHVWGDAADIFIDENPQDGRMDDLNQDGTVDSLDAEAMYDLIESEYDSRYHKLLIGGLARYRETSSHGPFVHIDVRGVASRWGAQRATKGTMPLTLPVALHGDALSHQPSYWERGSETEATP